MHLLIMIGSKMLLKHTNVTLRTYAYPVIDRMMKLGVPLQKQLAMNGMQVAFMNEEI
jgi:hypothetical protein